MPSPARPDPRATAIGRLSAGVYRVLVATACFALATSPGLVGILLLDRSPGNLPLYALCLVPLAPAYSALLVVTATPADPQELSVWPSFWRAWSRNVRDVLWVWVPTLLIASVLATTLAFGAIAGVDLFFIGAAALLLVALALWAFHGIVLTSFFRFRARDIARLSLYYLGARPLVTLGAAAILVTATALVAFTSDWVLVLAAVLFAWFATVTYRPMIDDVTRRFTDGAAAGDQG